MCLCGRARGCERSVGVCVHELQGDDDVVQPRGWSITAVCVVQVLSIHKMRARPHVEERVCNVCRVGKHGWGMSGTLVV
jgi:hypothetical protein